MWPQGCARAGIIEHAVADTTATGRTRERVLTMRGIGKHFGAVKALTDVDFWVNEGEVVALIGDNGAGKSTLVKVLAGVHAPDAGTIEFDGELVDIAQPRRRAGSGHRDRLPGPRAVRQPRRRREPVARAGSSCSGNTLDEVGMEERTWTLLRELAAKIPSVRVPVASLSGGQRQTVAIARSLVGEPRIIILDEPTAALGVAQTAEVLNLIERLRERGHGVILISHNMADVMAVADRVVVLRLGRNNGVYNVVDVTSETLIAAITGAVDGNAKRPGPADAAPADSPGRQDHPDAVGPAPEARRPAVVRSDRRQSAAHGIHRPCPNARG